VHLFVGHYTSADGQLYHQSQAAGTVAARLREEIGSIPLLIKIGHVTDEPSATGLAKALAPYADALVMINCIAATVLDEHHKPLFDGQRRGIAGEAIGQAVVDQVRLFARVIRQNALKLKIVGGGGIATAQHVREHLNAGSHAVQLATAAMLDPRVGLEIRRALADGVPK
jgi:dihydroorotate dehydrogenase (NAD+) catalytic subunit